MVRIAIIFCLMASAAHAETQTSTPEAQGVAPECDTCLARQNGKRALREYLAKKRAEEEAETDAKTDE